MAAPERSSEDEGSSGQKQLEVLTPERADQALIGRDDGVGQLPLGLLQLQDFLLHGVLGDQPVGEDGARLPDPVGAVEEVSVDFDLS